MMPDGQKEESFILRFGGGFTRINAYTLASTLVSLADAAKAANAALNPGYEIEIVVESLGTGSFRAKIRAIYNAAGNLFSSQRVEAIVLSVIASYIYQHTIAPDTNVTVKIRSDEVVIQAGEKQVIVPRTIYEGCRKVERSVSFKNNVAKTFQTIEKDERIEFLEIAHDNKEGSPISVPRKEFALLSQAVLAPDDKTREIIETSDLQIVRAILERGRRRWEFVWRGVRISAPVSDDAFYNRFFARELSIAPGDALKVRLKITQQRDQETGIYTNCAYEVVEVLQHTARIQQAELAIQQCD